MNLRSGFRRYGRIAGLWTIYGLVMAIFVYYRSQYSDKGPPTFPRALLGELCYAYFWAAITVPIFRAAARFPLTGPRWMLHAPIHVILSVASGMATRAAWLWVVAPHVYSTFHRGCPFVNRANIMVTLDFGIINYFLVLLCYHLMDYSGRFEQSRTRTVQLETQLARAQLQALKMQLHPHFLFNTLHAISELIHEDALGAERMIAKLSDFLRMTIDHSGLPEVTVREELDFVSRYLEIEKMRFEDRLEVELSVDRSTLEARVPNLILQPLVENALRHGLGRQTKAGFLRIEALRLDGLLRLRVFDNGPGFDPAIKPMRQGVGLTNTRERLERLYRGNHLFALANVASGGFEVTIQIPFRLRAES